MQNYNCQIYKLQDKRTYTQRSQKSLQETYSPYFSVENCKTVSNQLNGDKFSILHLNIRSLNKNIDNLRDFLASLKGKFSVIILEESWCDETANKNSLFDLENYNSVHKTRKNKKEEGFVSIFIKVYILR